METVVKPRRRKKEKPRDGMKSRTQSFGADIDELETDRSIVFDIEDNRKRRTIQLIREGGSCGFTVQTYGIKNKKTREIEVFTFVDYVEVTGPAHRAGLRKGDIILSVNGRNVEFATHKELVEAIQTSGDRIRMVVLFVDCCRKVELYDRLIKLKKLLSVKVNEYRDLERQEQDLLDDYCNSRGIERFQAFRQSIISTTSSLSSWDACSVLNSASSLLNLPNTASTHFGRDPSFSSSSWSSSEGDNSYEDLHGLDENYHSLLYMDENESDEDEDELTIGKYARRGTLKQEDSDLSLTNYFSNAEDRERRDTLVLGQDNDKIDIVDMETDGDERISTGIQNDVVHSESEGGLEFHLNVTGAKFNTPNNLFPTQNNNVKDNSDSNLEMFENFKSNDVKCMENKDKRTKEGVDSVKTKKTEALHRDKELDMKRLEDSSESSCSENLHKNSKELQVNTNRVPVDDTVVISFVSDGEIYINQKDECSKL